MEAETGVPAVVRMAEVIGAQTEGVTLVATGALTNVALLLTLYPELAGNQIRRIVFMVCPLLFCVGQTARCNVVRSASPPLPDMICSPYV